MGQKSLTYSDWLWCLIIKYLLKYLHYLFV
jgi:hypothetical protein